MKQKENAPIVVNDQKKEILYQSIKCVLLIAVLIIMLIPTVSLNANFETMENFPLLSMLIKPDSAVDGEMNMLECGNTCFDMLDTAEMMTEEGAGRIFTNILFVLAGISIYASFIGVIFSLVMSVVTIIMYAMGKGAQIEQIKSGTGKKGWGCGLFSMYGSLLLAHIAMGALYIASSGAVFGQVVGVLYRFSFGGGFHILIPAVIVTVINVVARVNLKPKN
ncbi:MAG: hypothetical protein IJW30_03970 [Clostridia bacterium]|nr:hypothetical protein [Clostridia bacterium]